MSNGFLAALSLTVAIGGSLLVAACGSSTDEAGFQGIPPDEIMELPQFQTPLAESEAIGIEPYWLGEGFEAGGLTFDITAGSQFIERGPRLELTYSALVEQTGTGRTTLDVLSYEMEGSGWSTLRDQALAVDGATSYDTTVGAWEGQVVQVPLGPRPINATSLYVAVGDAMVVVLARSGSTGVPETDLNPLVDADLLVSLLTEHLRPFPD